MDRFESHRGRLFVLAYRMLSSRADAELKAAVEAAAKKFADAGAISSPAYRAHFT